MNILVVDDEPTLRRTIRIALESAGHRVAEAADQAQALARVAEAKPHLVLLDLRLGRESGLDVLAALAQAAPGLGVVVITAHASIETAVTAMRRGALDYLPKPFTPAQLTDLVARWGGRAGDDGDGGDAGVLDSTEPAMRHALETVFAVAASDATVLLRGESGTGKGVLARAAHAPQPPGRRAVRHRPLPEPVGRPPRKRPVRPHPRRVHGRGQGHRRQGRRGRGRDAVPGRGRRPAAAPAAEAPAARAGPGV